MIDFLDFKTTTDLCSYLSSTEYDSLSFAVDIGGTNLRTAFGCHKDTTFKVLLLPSHRTSDANTVLDIIKGLAFELSQCSSNFTICKTVVSVAGPIDPSSDTLFLTNFTGSKELHIPSLPSLLFPQDRSYFLNDLTAACNGILTLNSAGSMNSYFKPLWPKDLTCDLSPLNYLVVMAGTGFGVGILIHHNNEFLVLPSEYGHSTLALTGPAYDLMASKEQAFAAFLSSQLYDCKHFPEFEDAVSGRGLEAAYRFLSSGEVLTAGQVSKRAIEGEQTAIDATRLFYRLLFRLVQQLAIGIGCKGVLLCGDNQVANDPIVSGEEFLEELRKVFENHPKQHWLKNVRVCRQVEKINLNLVGALGYEQ
ncbi:hypothetical protein P9112_013853 [Eukaryota sp. TZLM1-RC]